MQIRPQILREFLARDKRAALMQKQFQNAKRLLLQRNSDPAIAEFALFQINLKGTESK